MERPPTLPTTFITDERLMELSRFSKDDEVERKYNEIKKRSGILTIMGLEIACERSDIEEICDLGRGAFGAVKKAVCKKTNTFMAVKIIPLTDSPENNKRTVMDMDVIMHAHDCPNIVKCYGCFVCESEVRICMEVMQMCLEKLLLKAHRFPEKIVGKVTVSALSALQYLGEKLRIMHRDVKPSNILINLQGTIKMCDFGISGHLLDTSKAATDTKGCIAYLAPERIGTTSDYGVKADVWSLGITLVELATGVYPYGVSKNDFELLTKINSYPPPKIEPSERFSQEFCSFISHCLQKEPEKRLNYRGLSVSFLTHDYLLPCSFRYYILSAIALYVM
uniref:mitogen-activated protein kinase kinase n=1 Tax=Syphacia muris TaxID=451379 RepID=A0A0N5AGW7_9BILA